MREIEVFFHIDDSETGQKLWVGTRIWQWLLKSQDQQKTKGLAGIH